MYIFSSIKCKHCYFYDLGIQLMMMTGTLTIVANNIGTICTIIISMTTHAVMSTVLSCSSTVKKVTNYTTIALL